MAQGTPQTSWNRPKFTIDCVLANVSEELEADGCVLERLEGGHKCGYKLTTPDQLTAGDFVKVQLWLEGEETFYRHPAGGSQKGSHALDHGGSDCGEPK